MTVALRHVRHLPRQLPHLASLGSALFARTPRAEVTRTVAPPAASLIRDYVAHVGGDPAAYRAVVPPHLFPQWGLPLAARCLAGVHYPLARVLNAGCRLEVRAPLPAGAPLEARASLVSADDDGRRATLSVRVVTGTRETPDAVIATIRAVVPLVRGGAPRARSYIPYDATELARWHLDRDAGLAFALLTGDFNPIHWVTRAGVAAGFGGPILHGFAQLARAIEGVVRTRALATSARPGVWDARFSRPLRLPADVTLFAAGTDAWIGDARGGAPYLTLRGPS